MRKLVMFLALINLSCASVHAESKNSDPEVVKSVDLNRYAGFWYDIAHSPNFFQKKCLRSTAEYKVINETSISVLNTCYKAKGKISDIEGVAKIVNPAEPAKLKVRFNFFARGDYWITELDENYQWAVVSGPEKESIFILSRTAPMDPVLLNQIVATLKSKGYDTENLVYDQY